MSCVENDLGFLEEGNVFGVQYELGGSSGSKILELKKLVICAERTVVCVNMGKMESIVARDEDLVHGCSKLHDSILDIFQNTDNTFVGFNLHVLKYHLSALGINIGAAFIDLAKEKGIRNWEKGITDLIGFKKITHSDSSVIGRLSAGAYFARLLR